MRSVWLLLLLCCLCASLTFGSEPPPIALAGCHLEDLPEEVRCGELTVFEDRAAQRGRAIQIRVAVLPALRRSVRPDPLFIMAGGPGQGARSYAGLIARTFREVRRTRDIVLVDLRGTGASDPLNCPAPDDELAMLTRSFAGAATGAEADRQVAECVKSLAGDPRHFTHANALADLDDVRRALGYAEINLWGGSWGTRAALLYAVAYTPHVRTVVLDGAVPFGMGFPDTASADAQQALDAMLADCERNEHCHLAFPNLRDAIGSLLAQFDSGARTLTLRHPRSSNTVSVSLTREDLAEVLRASLYSPITTSRLPALIRQASTGDFAPLITQWFEIAAATTDTMALGATMAILCSEDLPLAPPAPRPPPASVFGDGYAEFWRSRCRTWPAGPQLPTDTRDQLTAPALILSGALDPVTPPRWGEKVAHTFPRHAHLVVPGAAHNVSFSGCVPELIAEFLETGAPERLDTTCAKRIVRPPFVLNSAGTQP